MENKTLLKLLQAVDSFYQRAMRGLALVRLAAEDAILSAAEDLWDQTDNKELADMLENLIASYQQFVEAVNKAPTADELDNPEQAADEDAETVGDIVDALNARWQRLINSPYLQKQADDESYTESEPPHKYMEVAEALANRANEMLENKTGGVVSPEEMKRMQEQVIMPNVPEPEQESAKAFWKARKKKYDEVYRSRIRDAKSIGLSNLRQVRERLMQQISTSIDDDQKRQMMETLRRMPKPETVENHIANVRRAYEAIMSDPARKNKYNQETAKRVDKQRTQDKQIYTLLDQYQQTQDPRILKQLVKIKEESLKGKGKNLDDPFIRESPMMKHLLDPMNLLKEYSTRQSGVAKYRAQEISQRQKRREEGRQMGSLPGLFDDFKAGLASTISDLKKALRKKIQSTALNDPAFKPYFEAIKSAPDMATRTKAEHALEEFVRNYVETHPLVVETSARLEGLADVRDTLKEYLVGRKNVYKHTWVPTGEMAPPNLRPVLEDAVRKLRAHLGIGFSKLSGTFEPKISNLADALEDRLGEP